MSVSQSAVFTNFFLVCMFTCQIPGFCRGGSSIPGIENKVDCDVIVGYKSVYRMCFAMACFFFLFSIIMIRVRSSKDPRAALQNGFVPTAASGPQLCVMTACCTLVAKHHYCTTKILSVLAVKPVCSAHTQHNFTFFLFSFWFFKFLALVGITVGAFFIPDGEFTTGRMCVCVKRTSTQCVWTTDRKLWSHS